MLRSPRLGHEHGCAWQELAEKMRREDRENGRGRRWRGNYTKLNAQLIALENDHAALELVHPQVGLP